MNGIERFFAYARERHSTYLRRSNGEPEPWSKDPILQKHRFTNVFRELDKTTLWFNRHVRGPLRDKPEVLLATVLFRLTNRIATGEAIFCQLEAGPVAAVPQLFFDSNDRAGRTPFESYAATGNLRALSGSVRKSMPRGPYTTGAYIISSPPGYSKLDGVLKIVDDFNKNFEWRELADSAIEANDTGRATYTLENVWHWLRQVPYLGTFHSYEIVTDLRHTKILGRASDVLTWANVGPGARRGANRVHGRAKKDRSRDSDEIVQEMRELLKYSRDSVYWPQSGKRTAQQAQNAIDWPKWELRDVEHTLCEFDKYERVRLGEGRPRGKFR